MSLVEVVLVHTRATKNTHRYDAENPTHGLRELYIQKTAVSDPPPQRIRVIVEEVS